MLVTLRAVPVLEAAMAAYSETAMLGTRRSTCRGWLIRTSMAARRSQDSLSQPRAGRRRRAGAAERRLSAVLDRFEEHESATGVAELLVRAERDRVPRR